MKILPVYADTSVYGGVFDSQFSVASKTFFEEVQKKKFKLLISDVVRRELEAAPQQVQDLFKEILPLSKMVTISSDALKLQQAYINEKVLSEKWDDDALHVALATVAKADFIVSWNFKHIVHFDKIPRFNAVNVLLGYKPIAIYSPLEVINYVE